MGKCEDRDNSVFSNLPRFALLAIFALDAFNQRLYDDKTKKISKKITPSGYRTQDLSPPIIVIIANFV